MRAGKLLKRIKYGGVTEGEYRSLSRLRRPRITTLLAGLALVISTFALYVSTLAPGVLYYSRPELMDAAMLQVHSYTLGISHPTGYPTYLMLNKLFTYLPMGDVAYRVNFASAVYGVFAVAGVYVAALLLCGRAIAALTGALAFAVGATFWSQTAIAEVHTLHALFVALVLVLVLGWRYTGKDYLLLAAALSAGLSLTNHMTSALILPMLLLFVYVVDRSKLFDGRLVLKGFGLFLVGLTPYLYLPARASMGPGMRESSPNDPGSFLTHVTGSELNGTLFGRAVAEVPGNFTSYAVYTGAEFGLAALLLAAIGVGTLLARDRAAALLTGGLYIGWLLYALVYDIPDVHLYYIPTYLILALWIAVGTGTTLNLVAETLGSRSVALRRGAAVMVGAVALLTVAWGADQTYAAVDRSDDREGRRIIEAVADNAAPGATVLHNRSSLWYMVLVEERRQDLTLLDPFVPEGITTYDLVWPAGTDPRESERLYSTADNTGVEAARKAAKEGAVYILDQESADASDFREAGFDIVEVEEDILYRLVP